jgi:hypothetical protein
MGREGATDGAGAPAPVTTLRPAAVTNERTARLYTARPRASGRAFVCLFGSVREESSSSSGPCLGKGNRHGGYVHACAVYVCAEVCKCVGWRRFKGMPGSTRESRRAATSRCLTSGAARPARRPRPGGAGQTDTGMRRQTRTSSTGWSQDVHAHTHVPSQ